MDALSQMLYMPKRTQVLSLKHHTNEYPQIQTRYQGAIETKLHPPPVPKSM